MLIGTIGTDPEVNSKNGFNVVKLSLATTESSKDKNTGSYVAKTEWHKLVLFGKAADIASSFVKKGSFVYVEGKIKTSKYQSKDGIEKSTTDIIVSSLTVLDKKSDNQTENNGNYKQSHYDQKSKQSNDFIDDDIPF